MRRKLRRKDVLRVFRFVYLAIQSMANSSFQQNMISKELADIKEDKVDSFQFIKLCERIFGAFAKKEFANN